MDPENQVAIKKFAEDYGNPGESEDSMIVVLGTSDIEGAEIAAETVTVGDPTFSGSLAGVSLGLPVYHILETEIKEAVPAEVYEENVGIWEISLDVQDIDRRFKEMREKVKEWHISRKKVTDI